MRFTERFGKYRGGSGFIWTLTAVLFCWVGFNLWTHFDRDLFLLNLVLSVEASYAMPVLMKVQAQAAEAESAKLREVLLATRDLTSKLNELLTISKDVANDLDGIEEKLSE